MSSLQAAMGASQVSEISARLEIKRKIADKYSAAFKKIDDLTLPVPHTETGRNGYWAYTLVLKDDYSDDAKGFCNKLSKKGIGTRPLFFPVHKQPVYKDKKAYNENYILGRFTGSTGRKYWRQVDESVVGMAGNTNDNITSTVEVPTDHAEVLNFIHSSYTSFHEKRICSQHLWN